MTSTIGIPIKLLNEAQVFSPNFGLTVTHIVALLTSAPQNHVITLEITSGQVYRGKLIEGLAFFPPNVYEILLSKHLPLT